MFEGKDPILLILLILEIIAATKINIKYFMKKLH